MDIKSESPTPPEEKPTNSEWVLKQEIPVYLSKPDKTSEFYLARFPGQVQKSLTTLTNSCNIKLKPNQKRIEMDIPLYGSAKDPDTLVPDTNCDHFRLENFRDNKFQHMEGVLQTDTNFNRLFAGQVVKDSDKDDAKMHVHLTTLNGILFFRPKQTILDQIDFDEKLKRKERILKEQQQNTGNSTDDDDDIEVTKPKVKTSSLTMKFDKPSSGEVDAYAVKNWKETYDKLDMESFISEIAVTGAGTTKCNEIRDVQMICQQIDRTLTEHQSRKEYLDATSGGQAETIATAVKESNAVVEDISTWDGLTVLEEKVFEDEAIARVSKLNYIWRKYNIKKSLEQTIDLYCERISSTSLPASEQLICLRSEIKFSKNTGSQKKAFVMTRDMSLLIFMEKQGQIKEEVYMTRFCDAYKKLYVGERDTIVKKIVRDIWRQFAKSSGQVNKKVWKLSKAFSGIEFDEGFMQGLRKEYKDEYSVISGQGS